MFLAVFTDDSTVRNGHDFGILMMRTVGIFGDLQVTQKNASFHAPRFVGILGCFFAAKKWRAATGKRSEKAVS